MTASSDRIHTAEHSAPTGLPRVPAQPDRTMPCRSCGTDTATTQARVTGAWSVVRGRPVWDCDPCTRALLIEFESVGRQPW